MDLSKHLEKAGEALRKKNFDYAISLYHQVLQLKPDHGEARRELRQALVRRAEYKKVPPLIALLQGLHQRLGILIGSALKKPSQVILSAEGYLRNDPHNRSVNQALAASLERAGHHRSAVAVWEFMGDDDQIGDHALKRAGALYYGMKQLTEALGCYEAVLKRSPRDSEAEKMRKNLAAEGVLSSGSYDPSRSSRDQVRDKDQQQLLEAEQKIVTTEDERALLRKKFEQTLESDPSDRRARRGLVEHHVKSRDYAEAISVLEAGLAVDPGSYELKERIGDIRVLDLDQQIRAVKQAAEQGDPAARTDLVDLTREKQEFEIEEFTRRVKEHPTDLDLRFRLGRLLLASGEVKAAIENFQHSAKDPRRRVDSLIGLGQAFERNQMLDLARKQFETALESVEGSSDRAVEIVYSLAVLLEKKGDLALARSRYESIYEKDIHYKDVAARLDVLRSKDPEAAPSEEPGGPGAPEAPEPAQEPREAGEVSDANGDASSTYEFKE